jgi:hypothetical protein
MKFDYDDDEQIIDSTMLNRRIAVEAVRQAEQAECVDLLWYLISMEEMSSPFFLGIDEDPDDSDMDVWP